MKDSSPLAEFWEFATDFKSVWSWVAKAAVFAPITDIALNIGPAWPSRIAICILTTISELLVLMYSFEFWRTSGVKQVRPVLKITTVAIVFSFLLYMYLFASFVVDVPDQWHREVIGFRLLPAIQELYDNDPSSHSPEQLLASFSAKPQRIWTPGSLVTTRVSLVAAWLGMWVCLCVYISAFVALQWIAKNKKRKVKNSAITEVDTN